MSWLTVIQNITANNNVNVAKISNDQEDDEYYNKEEAKTDKLVDEIFIYALLDPTERLEEVEVEIR